jgi:hypothetical protein
MCGCLVVSLLALGISAPLAGAESVKRPNIVFILADDKK